MEWKGRRRSSNVEDRRGERVSGASQGSSAAGGMLLSLFFRSSKKTKLFVVVAGLVAMFVFGISPMSVLNFVGGGSGEPVVTRDAPAPNDEMRAFLSTIKADNEDVWAGLFLEQGMAYRPAKMVIYSDQTVMPGGVADARMGPFYMPANETVYIDPHFFREMKERFGAPGDFAQAYVIAHEIGHHIQNLLGYTDKVHGQRGRASKKEYNQLSVRLELQADFLAGVFAHHADQQFNFLEDGDIREAMNCARAIGDDTLQKQSGGRVMPDSFTHGTSAQRAKWFMKGYRSGDVKQGNTFELPYGQL
ncbi:MAG: neutral zinc metallopeptidase [Verrucomicrobiota bacterium]